MRRTEASQGPCVYGRKRTMSTVELATYEAVPEFKSTRRHSRGAIRASENGSRWMSTSPTLNIREPAVGLQLFLSACVLFCR